MSGQEDRVPLRDMEKVKFEECVYNEWRGSITLYYIAPVEMLKGQYPEAKAMDIMIQFPSGHPELDRAQVMFSPTKGRSGYN